MIDINELRRLTQAATPGPWYIGSGIYEGRNIYSVEAVTDDEGFTYNPVVATAEDDEVAYWDANARLIAAANPAVISELLDRLEAAESECLEQARLNGMGGEREAALMAKLEAAEKDIAIKEEVIDSLAAVVKRLDAQCDAAERERDECNRRRLEAADHFAAQTELMKKKYDDLRAKLAEMEKQEPLDAGSDVFRSAFEAALKAGNWPATRQGDGYRSPSTQIAWRIAFSTVNRLKLYISPGAQGE